MVHRPWSRAKRDSGPWSRAPQARDRGFALLITVTMLAFIVVLLVGLAVFTRVETSVAGNSQRQAQARENALLALNVALAQLQRHAGPDQRVTATADAFSNRAGTRHYTGVWRTDTADPGTGGPVLQTWLVSGNEVRDSDGVVQALAVTPDSTMSSTNSVALDSRNTSFTNNDVQARLVPLTATVVPGATGTTPVTIGRYAWWVADQGVKAPVAIPDTSSSVTYAPYDSAELRGRLRQQIPLGPGAYDANGNLPVFEPRDSNNTSLVSNQKVTATAQLAFLKNSSNAQIGLTRVQQNFHVWSPNNFAVIANSKLGGLRQDLSVKPDLLGDGYVAWANYDPANGGYMEATTAAPSSGGGASTVLTHPDISPAYNGDPVRRRFALVPPTAAAGVRHSVAPVLSYFLLSFNIGTNDVKTEAAPLIARARWMVSLWNPYTSALVPPQNLRLEINNLPAVIVDDETEPEHRVAALRLEDLFGAPMKINLPWDASSSTAADRQSWLAGRVYSWTALEDLSGSATTTGFASKFYSHNLNADAGQGVQQPIPGVAVDGSHLSHLHGGETTLEITLYADDVKLGTFRSPQFDAFTAPGPAFSNKNYQITYLFRLGEPADGTAFANWLGTTTDPRGELLPSSSFSAGANGPAPELYVDYATINAPDRLLDRATDSLSYNEDVPIFELPRSPILSLGALQHLQLVDQRPFALGNSWGAGAQINGVAAGELFDRFYFSGLVNGVAPISSGGSLLLPNPLLKVFPRDRTTGAALTADDLRNAPDAKSAKFLLASSAFNLNSASVAAWTAVLRSVRFPVAQFSYLNASFGSGTSGDSKASVPASTDAQFFRFSQSAQETFKADDPTGGLTYAASTAAPPAVPDPPSIANTHLFRRGMCTLTAAEVTTLATRIVDAIKARQAALGPFRSLEEFLAPASAGAPSLLEQAIADAGINVDASGNPIEFSAQYLTQADIMTALAPVLFARSDTFLIRTYGEVVNPATSAVEGRAWCEATVQRMPEYLDAKADAPEVLPGDLTSDVNRNHGRRFKVVSFRWLTRSDI